MTIHHVAVAVTDLERARHFYGAVLGLAEIERPAFNFPGAWFAAGEAQIHLIVNTQARTLRGTLGIDSHDGHFALRVGPHDEMLRRLEVHGVPHRERAPSVVEWKRIFVSDPDGNVLELITE